MKEGKDKQDRGSRIKIKEKKKISKNHQEKIGTQKEEGKERNHHHQGSQFCIKRIDKEIKEKRKKTVYNLCGF